MIGDLTQATNIDILLNINIKKSMFDENKYVVIKKMRTLKDLNEFEQSVSDKFELLKKEVPKIKPVFGDDELIRLMKTLEEITHLKTLFKRSVKSNAPSKDYRDKLIKAEKTANWLIEKLLKQQI